MKTQRFTIYIAGRPDLHPDGDDGRPHPGARTTDESRYLTHGAPSRQGPRRALALATLIACLSLWCSLPAADEQPQPDPPLRLDWFSIDGGGGQGSGGDFTLLGSLGQHDAEQSGGDYRLVGGFWAILLQPQEPKPDLHLALAGNNTVISWPGSATGFQLEETMSLAPSISWSTVLQTPVLVNGEYTVTVPAAAGAKFYRLRKP